MSVSLNFKQVIVIICFVGIGYEGNLMTVEEKGQEKVKKELTDGHCCLEKGNETQIKGQEIKPKIEGKFGGKYRIPLPKTNRNLKPLRERGMKAEDGEGMEEASWGTLTSQDQLPRGTGNDTKLIYKRQKIFFRKDFVRRIDPRGKTKIIHVLGLFDLMQPKKNTKNLRFEQKYEKRWAGHSEILVAKLALKHVNERKLFGGYQMGLYLNDTKCDPGVAVDALFHALFLKSTPLPILLGPACSVATASLAAITPYWNIVQISFGATSPVLSNRKKFPMFYRVAAPDSSHNAAKLAFVRHFGWNTITFISQNEKEYILTVNYFIKLLEKENITCKGTVTFGKDNYEDQLKQLKDMDTRIIFGSFSEEMAPKIFCKVYDLGVYGSNYAWILHDNLKRKWWLNKTDCPKKKLKKFLQGVFFVSIYYDPDQPHAFHPNFTSKDLKKELSQRGIPISRFAHETYDAIWTAAIALNESLRKWSQSKSGTEIEDFNYDRYDMAQTIFHTVSLINSVGMSGPISFEGADRLGASAYYQLQGDNFVIVAIYSPGKSLNFTCHHCQPIIWEGGQVPVSQRFLITRIETISFKAFLVVTCCTSVAIFLAITFLIFNSYFRKLKNIKLSSPKLNNIAVAGCIAVYIGVFLLGLDYATIPSIFFYSAICTAKVYFFAAGFSLAFGSIFAKTYRIHKIFIKSQGGFIKKKLLQDRQLILLVGVLLLIDGLILTMWVVLDPLQRQLHNTTIEYSTINRSVIYQTQIEICSCKHMHSWLSFLYLYKGLQLLMGVFLAWETRKVKIPGLNDSQYIVLSVYSVVITSCIVVVLANLIFEKPTIAYLIISTMILSSTTVTLCSLFFPKVKIILSKSVDNCDPIMQSMGLILESNTRRFIIDDAKEKLYRLEVQNRVYKREAFILGNEISRLEKQLSSIMLPQTRSLRDIKIPRVRDGFYNSHLEISTTGILEYCEFSNQYSAKFLARSWPSEIHKIPLLNSVSYSKAGQRLNTSKKNSTTKNTSGREKMKNFIKSTINTNWRKEPNDDPKSIGKTRRDHKKFVLSQYLPYVQKTISGVKSTEELRESHIWIMDKEKPEDKWRTRRKSQPSSRLRFKGSPRFPHKIVPRTLFIPEIEPEPRVFEELKANTNTNMIMHEVEVVATESDTEKM